MASPIDCTTCGEPATHLYAVYDVTTRRISSVNGLDRWSPSCDDCDDPEIEQPEQWTFRITGPLRMWINPPESRGS